MTHSTSDNHQDTTPSEERLPREKEVLGDGPRIEPLAVDDMSEDLLSMIQSMVAVNEAIDARGKEELTELMPDEDLATPAVDPRAQLANLPEIMRTMLHHPQLFARQTEIGIQLLGKGALPARERELAVLRIGWLCQAPYEWGEHVHVAKKAGLNSEEIERITQGPDTPEWSELDRAILAAVDELHGNAMISDVTWGTLARYFNEQQLIELPILIGQYQTVSYYQNSLRLRLHEGNRGLKAR